MKTEDTATMYGIQRCLDAFFIWLAILFVLIVGRGAFRTDGSLSLILVVPVFGMAWAALGFPEMGDAEWSLVRVRLRVSALVCAGCAPLVVYWSRNPNNLYLLANCFCCLVGGGMMLLQLSRLLRMLSETCRADTLAKEARLTYNLIFWITLVGTCGGGFGVLAIALLLGDATPMQLVRACGAIGVGKVEPKTLKLIWVAVMMVLFSPLIFFVSVTFRTRLVTHFNLLERLKGERPNED